MTARTGSSKLNVQRPSKIEWVRLGDLHVSERAQRGYREDQAVEMAASLDLGALGYPVVSRRDGACWLVDGQHRVAALRICGWGKEQYIECEVYENLTEPEEAELFLKRDKRRAINAYDKYRIAVVAERPTEVRIDEIVGSVGLAVSRQRGPDHVLAVDALRRVHALGENVLVNVLVTLRETFGEYASNNIIGLGLVYNRYQGQLDVEQLHDKLLGLRGGSSRLDQRARQIQTQTGVIITHCVAAAIVDVYNTKPGKRVTSFFKANREPNDAK